jgi:hypothetical protein
VIWKRVGFSLPGLMSALKAVEAGNTRSRQSTEKMADWDMINLLYIFYFSPSFFNTISM